MASEADVEIFTALNVPTPGPHPSVTCAQWSGDGQLIVPTKNAVYILTPDLGINFDNLSLLKTDRRNFRESDSKDPGLDLGWHRNLIELDKTVNHSWTAESQEFWAANLGSLDMSWRSVAPSPGNLSNVSTGSGSNSTFQKFICSYPPTQVLARNHEHEPGADAMMQDITLTLKELPTLQDEGSQDHARTCEAQANCIAWSEQADFGAHPSPLVDGSILAVGSRSGSIILLRFDGKQRLEPIRVIDVADEWITHLAWGPWRSLEPFHSESYLACGLASGAIIVIQVRQKLESTPSVIPFGSRFLVRTEVDVLEERASSPDSKGITALAWVDRLEVPQEMPTLFHAKPGLFHFYRVNSMDTEAGVRTWAGENLGALRIQIQKTSIDSSSLYPVSGLSRIFGREHDILIATLFDGSFHVVRNACTSPTLYISSQHEGAVTADTESNHSENPLNSVTLSQNARFAFLEAEGGALQHLDVGRISGAVGFDGFGAFLWLHESCRPTQFVYKHEAKHNCMLVVTRLWQDSKYPELVLRYISETFERPRSVTGIGPASKLRPILLHLCQRLTFDTIWPHVMERLSTDLYYGETTNFMEAWSAEIDDQVRLAFKTSLAVDLYGWDAFHSLRLRLSVADYCWKMSPNEEIRNQFGQVAQTLLSSISHRFMKVLVKHLTAVIQSLTAKDLPFLMRVIVQSLLEGSPPDLLGLAQTLNETAKAKFSDVPPDAFGLSETCPACRSPIPLENLLTAVCPQGHAWARCSITSFVLATPLVRTCSGCTRKAFLAPSSRMQNLGIRDLTIDPSAGEEASTSSPPSSSNLWIPEAGRSWIVDELLEAARCCLYCGNRFICIL